MDRTHRQQAEGVLIRGADGHQGNEMPQQQHNSELHGQAEFCQSSTPFASEVLNIAMWFKVSVRDVPSPSPTGTRQHFCRRHSRTQRRPGRPPPRRARSTGHAPVPHNPALGPPGSLCTTNNRLTCDGDDRIQHLTLWTIHAISYSHCIVEQMVPISAVVRTKRRVDSFAVLQGCNGMVLQECRTRLEY